MNIDGKNISDSGFDWLIRVWLVSGYPFIRQITIVYEEIIQFSNAENWLAGKILFSFFYLYSCRRRIEYNRTAIPDNRQYIISLVCWKNRRHQYPLWNHERRKFLVQYNTKFLSDADFMSDNFFGYDQTSRPIQCFENVRRYENGDKTSPHTKNSNLNKNPISYTIYRVTKILAVPLGKMLYRVSCFRRTLYLYVVLYIIFGHLITDQTLPRVQHRRR